MRHLISRAVNSYGKGTLETIVVDRRPFDPHIREEGLDWPDSADTMIGLKRLNNAQFCVEQVIKDKIPGDVVEAGVWRGGASILMRAVMRCHGESNRTMWLADSFEGLPPPNPKKYPADSDSLLHTYSALEVSQEQVEANFCKYGMLDGGVGFIKGWFGETLPGAPTGPLAVIRADGDMYESTMDILVNLYPRLSAGGFVIIDDYSNPYIPACARAVTEFREANKITDEIIPVDWTAVYWRKS